MICISYVLNLKLLENLSGEEGNTTAVLFVNNVWFFTL